MSTREGIPLTEQALAKSLMIMVTVVVLLSIATPVLAQQNRISSHANGSPTPSRRRGPAVLTVGALVYAGLAWKNSYWGIAFRAYYTLVTGGAVAFVWFLNQWNLLGWRY